MPKELIHFKTAQRTADLLGDTRFAPLLADESHGLRLGSVFHDALFYAVWAKAKPLEKLAHRFHGSGGEDTFDLVRMQARHAGNAKDKALPAALLVGMVSHLFADAAMHPMVWHHTGDYYDTEPAGKSRSRQRHRAMESLMDMVACPEMIGNADYSLRHLLRQCDKLFTDGLPMAELAVMAGMDESSAINRMAGAWALFAALQTAFPIRALAGTLHTAASILPDSLKEIATLFYAPQLMDHADFLKGDIAYTHPVTGETQSATLDRMIDQAATQAATLCRDLEPTIFDDAPLSLKGNGPSMEGGITNTTDRQTLHFAKIPFPPLK